MRGVTKRQSSSLLRHDTLRLADASVWLWRGQRLVSGASNISDTSGSVHQRRSDFCTTLRLKAFNSYGRHWFPAHAALASLCAHAFVRFLHAQQTERVERLQFHYIAGPKSL
jgi:hypothetical protein